MCGRCMFSYCSSTDCRCPINTAIPYNLPKVYSRVIATRLLKPFRRFIRTLGTSTQFFKFKPKCFKSKYCVPLTNLPEDIFRGVHKSVENDKQFINTRITKFFNKYLYRKMINKLILYNYIKQKRFSFDLKKLIINGNKITNIKNYCIFFLLWLIYNVIFLKDIQLIEYIFFLIFVFITHKWGQLSYFSSLSPPY